MPQTASLGIVHLPQNPSTEPLTGYQLHLSACTAVKTSHYLHLDWTVNADSKLGTHVTDAFSRAPPIANLSSLKDEAAGNWCL